MYNRLINYFQKNNVFFNVQFGFLANHSTAQAVLLITDKIQNSIENKLFSCGIFLDLSKAFYTVNHDILIMNIMVSVDYRGIAFVPI
jgi:retron-type reverse transcriptase